jgi:hypothetical protein
MERTDLPGRSPQGEPFDFTGYEAAAGRDLVDQVDAELDGRWRRIHDGPGMWSWTLAAVDDDDRQTLWITVNARPDRVLVPAHGWPDRMGPTILAGRMCGPLVSVTLPSLSDRTERQHALTVIGRYVTELT